MGYFNKIELRYIQILNIKFYSLFVPFHERGGGFNLIMDIAIFNHFYGAHTTLTNSEPDISHILPRRRRALIIIKLLWD